MDPTPDPYDYSPETLLRAQARELAEMRELVTLVAGDLERLAAEHPQHAERFLARAMRLRKRLHEAGSRARPRCGGNLKWKARTVPAPLAAGDHRAARNSC